MTTQASEEWDGRETRTSLHLRQLLDHINERILEIHRDVMAQSVQVAQIRAELDHLKIGSRTTAPVASKGRLCNVR